MEYLSTPQAARRLGVKPATLYAYVSRGVLTRHRTPDGRRSRFARADVEVLARRGRPRRSSRSTSFDIEIETAITDADGHHVRYRGHDATAAAGRVCFERVAELLWTGLLPDRFRPWPGERVEVPDAITGVRARLRMAATLAASSAGIGDRLDPDLVVDEGRTLIATLVDSLPANPVRRVPALVLDDGRRLHRTIAGRLWPALRPARRSPELVGAVDVALVLLADHEMAASTLAVRVAASVRSGVSGVIAAGMGALAGPFHGGASAEARRLLREAVTTSPARAVEAALDRDGLVPGHGHVLYREVDPRFVELMRHLARSGDDPVLDAVGGLGDAVRRRGLPPANVDLALAALGEMAGMPDDAGEAIFTVARTAGWLAHAVEELAERPVRFRPRATYVGP